MSGEEAHGKGRDGAMRAKRWLEATTRAQVHWVNPDPPAVHYLEFKWADAELGSFSYDLGGVLEGGAHRGKMFVAESKNYATANDQGTAFEEFLAKCYRVASAEERRPQVFVWVTWAAFWSTKWDTKCSPDQIRASVIKHRVKVFNEVDQKAAESLLDEALVDELSSSLWVLVLSKEQETHLVLSKEHLALVKAHIVKEAS